MSLGVSFRVFLRLFVCLFVSFRVFSCLFVCLFVSFRVFSCLFASFRVFSCLFVSFRVFSCLFVSFRVLVWPTRWWWSHDKVWRMLWVVPRQMCKFDTYTGSALKGVQVRSMRISLEAITVIMPLYDRKCRFQTIKTKQTKWHTPSVQYDMSEGCEFPCCHCPLLFCMFPATFW